MQDDPSSPHVNAIELNYSDEISFFLGTYMSLSMAYALNLVCCWASIKTNLKLLKFITVSNFNLQLRFPTELQLMYSKQHGCQSSKRAWWVRDRGVSP